MVVLYYGLIMVWLYYWNLIDYGMIWDNNYIIIGKLLG